MGAVSDLVRTLDQELLAIMRGASLECLVCGEFVMHAEGGALLCPECGSGLRDDVVVEPALPANSFSA